MKLERGENFFKKFRPFVLNEFSHLIIGFAKGNFIQDFKRYIFLKKTMRILNRFEFFIRSHIILMFIRFDLFSAMIGRHCSQRHKDDESLNDIFSFIGPNAMTQFLF